MLKSITKRIGAVLLALIMLVSFAGVYEASAYTDEDGDRWFALDEEGYELETILSQDGKWLYSEYKDGIMVSSDRERGAVCEIPAYIDGKKVVAVCGENLRANGGGGGGFGDVSIEADEIILPSTVHTLLFNTAIASGKDKKIAVPSSVITIGDAALNQYSNYKLTIVCVKDSAAHKYAEEHNLTVELVDESYFPEPEVTTYEPPKKGAVIHDGQGTARYIVINGAKKEVAYKEPINKTGKTVAVPATVKIVGITYKVTGIEANAFKGCKNLKTLTIKSTQLTKKNISKNAFKGVTKKTTIKVPKKKLTSYKKLFKSKGLSSKVKVTK